MGKHGSCSLRSFECFFSALYAVVRKRRGRRRKSLCSFSSNTFYLQSFFLIFAFSTLYVPHRWRRLRSSSQFASAFDGELNTTDSPSLDRFLECLRTFGSLFFHEKERRKKMLHNYCVQPCCFALQHERDELLRGSRGREKSPSDGRSRGGIGLVLWGKLAWNMIDWDDSKTQFDAWWINLSLRLRLITSLSAIIENFGISNGDHRFGDFFLTRSVSKNSLCMTSVNQYTDAKLKRWNRNPKWKEKVKHTGELKTP